MANNGSRYHAEIKIELDGREARINVFADTLAEIFQDLANVCVQYPPGWKNPARREILNAENLAKTIPSKAPQVPPAVFDPGQGPEVPVCAHCGEWAGMELIPFRDKKTGKPKQAWKCQACDQWHFPDKK